jgi:hypothetical protein
MKRSSLWASALFVAVAVAFTFVVALSATAQQKSTPTYDINTLAGKVASVKGTAGLQIRFSALIEEEGEDEVNELDQLGGVPLAAPVAPTILLTSPLDGTTVAPNITVNQDRATAPQNETSIVVDPNNPQRIVAGANDYVTTTWTCFLGATPCSALGDGYSGSYFSNDGGNTWCCSSALNGTNIGTLIPGVEHFVGGPYDAGGDPAVAFDSRGNVYYAGLGFNRNSAPNTVAVNKGAFAGGNLTWGAPVFINQTTSPATLNDKEWIAVDSHVNSPFRDRIYITWTRFLFNPKNGAYVQSPIAVSYSSDGGQTFSAPQLIVGNVLYGQGSRPVVGPDGAVYVFWDGSTRLATRDSIWEVKSTDGGVTWSKPLAISEIVDIIPVANTAFRVNSYPATAAAPNGDLYVTWASLVSDSTGGLCPTRTNAGCHSAALYSKSTDGGSSWTAPALLLPAQDAANRTPIGYTGAPPASRRVDTFFPAISVASTGQVYASAYAADVVSPWTSCTTFGTPSLSGTNCAVLGPTIDNARLDYVVRDLNSGVTNTVTGTPINTRYQFRGTFFGDYTDIAAGSDGVFHALWTDSNNVQTVDWFGGVQWQAGTSVHQQDVVTAKGSF